MPIASTHSRQRSKNLLLLGVLIALIGSIYYLTVIRVGKLAALPREIPVGATSAAPSAAESTSSEPLEK